MLDESADLGSRMLAFYETLRETLPAKSRADLTCYRRLSEFLAGGVRAKKFNPEIFHRVLMMAREATSTAARNPRAVFMANVRKEIGYVARKTT
jgi:hypothetical protein